MSNVIPLLTGELPPRLGGIATHYDSIVKRWPDVANGFRFEPVALQYGSSWVGQSRKIIRSVSGAPAVAIGEVLPWGLPLLPILPTLPPLIIFFHGLDIIRSAETLRKRIAVQTLLRRTAVVVCNSFATADLFRSRFSDYRGSVAIAHPILPEAPKVQPLVQYKKHRKFLFLGRLVERKGIIDILKAWSSVVRRFPDASLTIVGEGPAASPLTWSDMHRVRWLGAVSDERKAYELLAHDYFLFAPQERADDFEGFGIVLLEAAQAGMRIFARISGGVQEAVHAPATVVLPQDSRLLADAIIAGVEAVESDTELDGRLREEQQAYVQNYFSDPKTTWQAAAKIIASRLHPSHE